MAYCKEIKYKNSIKVVKVNIKAFLIKLSVKDNMKIFSSRFLTLAYFKEIAKTYKITQNKSKGFGVKQSIKDTMKTL